ncbi:hypothetical protein Lal_00004226 [Lupinus albus]|nr:hypothetical protein Lal_00004226 [Lupinus albus]
MKAVQIAKQKEKGIIPWRLANSWHRCLGWIASMNFKVSHIYREGNACADSLASFGAFSQMYTWWDDVPGFIFEDFNRNRLGLPTYKCYFM